MQRIKSIDTLRGAIMLLMAIDHVRLFGGIPAGGPTAGLFFTRWVTHFCVSGFVFFAGAAIFLHGQKPGNTKILSRFLLVRGLLLMALELTLIRFCWTFNFDFPAFMLFGVIWMLGCCMVLMAGLIRVNMQILAITGLIIILIQTLFHKLPLIFPGALQEPFAFVWNFFYPTPLAHNETINVLYVIIPWIGVMMAGYAFGNILIMPAERRNKICIVVGSVCILLFLLIGTIVIFKQGNTENIPFVYRLLNQQKYPASPLFLLMTLGPLIALVALAARARGWLANVLTIFGRVPLFYYILHVLLIHCSALVVNLMRTGLAHQDWYHFAPFYTTQPEGIRWPLWMLYAVLLIDLIILFFACSWYAKLKANNPKTWMKYF